MLSLSNIYIQYGNRILLDSVNFVFKPGERVSLVGCNGAGKSTKCRPTKAASSC